MLKELQGKKGMLLINYDKEKKAFNHKSKVY